jgi:hypothetical protein
LAVRTRPLSAIAGDLQVKETLEQIDNDDGVMTLAGAKVGELRLSKSSCERCQQMIFSFRDGV